MVDLLKNNREPLITGAIVVSLVAAAIQLLVAFGIPLTPDQTQAIMGFVTILAPLVVAWLVRGKVTPLADPRNNRGEKLVPTDAEEIL